MHTQCRTNDPPTFKHCSRILRGMKLLSLLAVLGLMNTPTAVAVEPAIHFSDNQTLALRNDGVLFQFGGLFSPVTLEPPLSPAMKPENAILTNIASVSTRVVMGEQRTVAITQDGHVFTWQSWKSQPAQLSDWTNIKEVFFNQEPFTMGPFHFALNKDGTVFHFDNLENPTVTEISELSDIKMIATGHESYYALTNTGDVFYGKWDWQSEQFESPIQVVDSSKNPLSGVSRLIVNPGTIGPPNIFCLTQEDQIYWIEYENTANLTVSEVTAVYHSTDQMQDAIFVLKNAQVYYADGSQVDGFSNVKIKNLYFPRGSSVAFALTNQGDIYRWGQTDTTKIEGFSDIKTFFPYLIDFKDYLFATTNAGEVYVLLEPLETPVKIDGLSNVKDIEIFYQDFIPQFAALTETGSVYQWEGLDDMQVPQVPKPATQVSELANVTAIFSGGTYILALKTDGMLCGWGDNTSMGIYSTQGVVCDLEDLIVTNSNGQHTLTVNLNGNGYIMANANPLICEPSCSADYFEGESVTLHANPELGNALSGWGGDCTGTDELFDLTMNGPKTCSATFVKAPDRTLTVNKEGTGSGTVTGTTGKGDGLDCGSNCTEVYLHGRVVFLNATAQEGSKFVKWSGDCTQNHFAMTTDMTCTATFDVLPKYTLNTTTTNVGGTGSITSQPAGIDCGSDCTEDYFEGTDVTLTATPDTNSSFMGWTGDCESSTSSQATLNMDQALSCTAKFGLLGTPAISVSPTSLEFVTKIGGETTRTIRISNTGNGGLLLGAINLASNHFVLDDACSNTSIAPAGSCEITVQYQPQLETVQTATLSIPSNDQATPTVTIPLEGSGCISGSYQRYVDIYPGILNFGTEEATGNSTALMQNVHTWTQGCGSAEIDSIEFEGADASEFSFKDQHCYYGGWENSTYSSCQFTVIFTPTSSVNTKKDAKAKITLSDGTVRKVLIIANAVPTANPKIAVSATSHDFGSVVLGRGSSDDKAFTVTNDGNVNLKIDQVEITGADKEEFHAYHWGCSYNSLLPPGKTCEINARFVPTLSAGSKQANLSIVSNAPTTNIGLTGTVTEPADCSDSNITIESVSDGSWEVASTWSVERMPSKNDAVRINSGHTITGLPFTKVKALCIQKGGTLASWDDQGTPLEIQVSDYIENNGLILGQNGADESSTCTTPTDTGTGLCAMPGASIILKVGAGETTSYGKSGDQWWYSYSSGGPILNTGQILAGNGGNGTQYAAHGGDAIVLGRNLSNKHKIKAGDGGSLTGTGPGEAGKGGVTQLWGKLGGPGYLYNQHGAQALAGNGGSCNSSAQTGGDGGNLWLVSLPNVYLSGGTHKAGNQGNNCSNGTDGWVRIEPLLIDLSDANTQVSGGNVFIYGGDDTTLDLSNLNGVAINATGDVILAVGANGVIDLSGNTSPIIKAAGKVHLLSDNIISLGNEMTLDDLIEAGEIIRGRSEILHEVSLAASDQVMVQEPGTTTTINLTIANNGPEADTYKLKVTNPKGWTLSALPATLEVDALSTIELTLDITFSETPSELNVITVTATSQNDTEVSATATIQVAVTGGTLANATTGSTAHSGMSPSRNQMSLFVEIYGTGSGQVTSDPGGIHCQPEHCQAVDYAKDIIGKDCDPNYCQAIVDTGKTVTITTKPDPGSMFRGWLLNNCDGEVMMDRNKLCVAIFAKLQPLSMNIVGHGTVKFNKPHQLECSDDKCVAQFGHGTQTHIKAVPETGYRFLGWSGDCAGMNPILQLNIRTNQTCTAHFE
jgi:alpha-tubulin suppressor-like RCC1 family protein